MFSRNNRITANDPKEQRIHELESELDAAKRLIEDQQAILKANLAALADEHERVPSAPPAHPHPTAEPGRAVSYSDQPPIKLPDLGLPAATIAGRVIQAAAERGVVPAPSGTTAPTTEDSSTTRHEPRPITGPRKSAVPLIISVFLFVGACFVALAWSRWQPFAQRGQEVVSARPIRKPEPPSEPPQQQYTYSGRTADPHPGPTLEPAVTAPPFPDPKTLATVASARRAVKHNRRLAEAPKPKPAPIPVAIARAPKPAVRSAAPLVARIYHKAASLAAAPEHRHRTVQLATVQDGAIDDPELSAEAAQREETLREEYSPRPLRRPEFYRHRDRPRDDYDDYEIHSDFNREARRHPRPGRDEQEDRWLDRF